MICWVCSLIECCGSIGITVIHYRVGLVVFAARYVLLPTLIIILDVVVDVVNTTTLCYYLHQRSYTISVKSEADVILNYGPLKQVLRCPADAYKLPPSNGKEAGELDISSRS